MTSKIPIAMPLFMLVGGPKNIPLMLEQRGIRYTTLFTTEAAVVLFQQVCCSLDAYQLIPLPSLAEVKSELQTTQNCGCSMLVIDPPGPEVDRHRTQSIAAFLRQLAADMTSQPTGKG